MWGPFKRAKPVTYRTKSIDWDRVTTLEEVILILSKLGVSSNIRVDEEHWNDSNVKHLLGPVITETTYCGFDTTTKVYEE